MRGDGGVEAEEPGGPCGAEDVAAATAGGRGMGGGLAWSTVALKENMRQPGGLVHWLPPRPRPPVCLRAARRARRPAAGPRLRVPEGLQMGAGRGGGLMRRSGGAAPVGEADEAAPLGVERGEERGLGGDEGRGVEQDPAQRLGLQDAEEVVGVEGGAGVGAIEPGDGRGPCRGWSGGDSDRGPVLLR